MSFSDKKSDSVVIIPTYNEKENIADIILAVLGLEDAFDVLVIDDNSPDGTASIVKKMIDENPGRVHLLEREGKLGLGTAYILGFKWSLEQGYSCIIEMDDDFSQSQKKLIELRYFQDKTQTEVAKTLGISQVQVSRLEKKLLLQMRNSIDNKSN